MTESEKLHAKARMSYNLATEGEFSAAQQARLYRAAYNTLERAWAQEIKERIGRPER